MIKSRITICLNECFKKESQKFSYEGDYSFDFVLALE